MHQRVQRSCDVAVVNEKIFLNVEFWVETFKIAGMIVFDPMSQDQILRARRRPDRIRLHETQALQGLIERGRFGKFRATVKRRRSSREIGIGEGRVSRKKAAEMHKCRWILKNCRIMAFCLENYEFPILFVLLPSFILTVVIALISRQPGPMVQCRRATNSGVR